MIDGNDKILIFPEPLAVQSLVCHDVIENITYLPSLESRLPVEVGQRPTNPPAWN